MCHFLVYVEIDQSNKVVSFGQHFRYRWAYADSIRTVDRNLNGEGKFAGKPRAQVHPDAQESVKGEEAGDRLTVARALFGYVAGDNPGSGGIGEGVYSRLAGRIAINHAVEQIPDGAKPDDRFFRLSDENAPDRFDVPLKILGGPKASAVEHYLEHKEPANKELKTYGDLPDATKSGTPTPLAGRKFYRHQLLPDFIQKEGEERKKNQSTLARYISREDRTFRFTVRFKDLRGWELGALLLALNPDYARDGLPGIIDKAIEPKPGDAVVFANKLGHGRPLGLGSVRIDVNEIRVLDENLDLKDRSAEAMDRVNQAVSEVNKDNTRILLNILNWKERQKSVAYPNADSNIYTYHTNIRAHHSKRRRMSDSKMPEDFHEPVRP